MKQFFLEYYLALKALHLIGVISWMAGLFYLPRLFVYHVTYPNNAPMLEIMERKLYMIIMQPAMIITAGTGLILLFTVGNLSAGWAHAKLTCAILLIMFHFQLNVWRKQLLQHTCSKSAKFFRTINEIPTILMILIIILVIMKPS